MRNEDYATIRNRNKGNISEILFTYYKMSFPDNHLSKPDFEVKLSNWIMIVTMGVVHPGVGGIKIIEYLDKKHNYGYNN